MKRNQFIPSFPSYLFFIVLLLAVSVLSVPALAVDADGDGYDSAVDCVDDPAGIGGIPGDQIHPGAVENWYDGIDQDCDGWNDYDMDQDGYVSTDYPGEAGGTSPGTGDCDDTNAAINPGAPELCDGIDNNCNSQIDEVCDTDEDGLYDNEEVQIGTDPNNADTDGDTVDDYYEVTNGGGSVANPTDSDNDGIIDPLDTDDDNDEILTIDEDLNGNGDPVDEDLDGDGTPNYLDTDDDGDGVLTKNELMDSDSDGVPDAFESVYDDSDGDGLNNQIDNDDDGDNVPTAAEDRNANGNLFDDDTDGDTGPDFRDPDDDGDGILTKNEDANANGDPTDDDSDLDGIPDYLDAAFTCNYLLAGDLDTNCKVDLADLAILAGNWLVNCAATPSDPACVSLP